MKRTAGFTLVEMMIVVAIMAVIAAIAIPNLLRSRIHANEAATIEDLHTIASAQIAFHTSNNRFGDFDDLTLDAQNTGNSFLGAGWTEGRERNGYSFSMPQVTPANFICFADPISPGNSGIRYFRVDGSGLIRYSVAGQPDESDAPLDAH